MAAPAPKLDAIKGLVFAAARRAGAPPDLAEKTAGFAVEAIVAEFSGAKVYIPSQRLAINARDEMMIANHRAGVPIERIMAQTRLSRRNVLRILQCFGQK